MSLSFCACAINCRRPIRLQNNAALFWRRIGLGIIALGNFPDRNKGCVGGNPSLNLI